MLFIDQNFILINFKTKKCGMSLLEFKKCIVTNDEKIYLYRQLPFKNAKLLFTFFPVSSLP